MRIIMGSLVAAALAVSPALAQQSTEKEVETFTLKKEDAAPGNDVEVEKKVETSVDGKKTVKVEKRVRTSPEGDANIDERKAERMLSDCSGRTFTASAMVKTEEGKLKKTNIKLCGTSDDDADWVKLLKDAKEQISASDQLEEQSRADIITDIDTEIARYETPEGGWPGR